MDQVDVGRVGLHLEASGLPGVFDSLGALAVGLGPGQPGNELLLLPPGSRRAGLLEG